MRRPGIFVPAFGREGGRIYCSDRRGVRLLVTDNEHRAYRSGTASPALPDEVPRVSLERAGGRRGDLSMRRGRWFALADSDRGGAGGLEFLEPCFEVFVGMEVIEDFGWASGTLELDVEVWRVGSGIIRESIHRPVRARASSARSKCAFRWNEVDRGAVLPC
jgi:hypothetical protein